MLITYRRIMIFNILLLLTFLPACSHHPELKLTQPDQSELVYEITPLFNKEGLQLQVKLKFRGDEDGRTTLLLPPKWAGQNDLHKGISDIQFYTNGVSSRRLLDSPALVISHKPSQEIHLRYTVLQYWSGKIDKSKVFRPILRTNYFHAFGYGMIVCPDWDNEIPIRVVMNWKNIPSDWSLANSFGANTYFQDLKIRIRDLKHAVYLGGDFHIEKISIGDHPLYIALRGQWDFSKEDLFKTAEKIIKSQRDFWNDYEYPYYLISLIPLDEMCHCSMATNLFNSFSMFMSPQEKMDGFKHTLSHEHFHNWNGGIIETKPPPELMYWFSEGFTNYYSRLLNLRSGLISLNDYAKSYNKAIERYFTSPVRNTPNKTIGKKYWDNVYARRIPYDKGDILAHNWNADIKIKSRSVSSLDNMMLGLLQEAKTQKALASPKSIDKIISPYKKVGIKRDIKNYVDRGMTLKFHPEALGPCFKLTLESISKFHLGFDYDRTDKLGRIVGVWKKSNAYRAGIRTGQKIITQTINWYEPEKLSSFKVGYRDGSEKVIEYYPKGEKTKIFQYKFDEDMFKKNPEHCFNWFSKQNT